MNDPALKAQASIYVDEISDMMLDIRSLRDMLLKALELQRVYMLF